MTRAAVVAVALLALLFAVATVREVDAGARAVADSDTASARGDILVAMARARDAAEAVVPGSPYPRGGYARLEAIARAAESRGDERAAVAAWGAMRAAATATGSPLVPSESWRALADDGLTRAGAPRLAPVGEVHATEATLRAALAREDAPPTGVLALLGFGALAFFAGCARLAFAAEGLPALRRERMAVAAAAVGALLYAVACFRA